MAAAAGDQDAANLGPAATAWEACSLVHAVFDLKQARFADSIDVVRNGRATQANRVPKNLLEGDTQPLEFRSRQAACHAPGADSGMEQAFVGVNVSHACEKRLVEESGFDRKASIAEERGKCLGRDGKRLETRYEESFALTEIFVVEAAEAAGIDETEFAATQKRQARVGMRRHRSCWVGDEKAAGHAEVNDPLRFWGRSLRLARYLRTAQFANNVLARAMD